MRSLTSRACAVAALVLTAAIGLGGCSRDAGEDDAPESTSRAPGPSGGASAPPPTAPGTHVVPTRFFDGTPLQHSQAMAKCLRAKGWKVTEPTADDLQIRVQTKDAKESVRAGKDMQTCQGSIPPVRPAASTTSR